MYVLLSISAHFDLASTKSSHSPNWRVQNRFGEYETEVTRHFGEYEIFLMSNPVVRNQTMFIETYRLYIWFIYYLYSSRIQSHVDGLT